MKTIKGNTYNGKGEFFYCLDEKNKAPKHWCLGLLSGGRGTKRKSKKLTITSASE